ncbi:MAG: LysE family translocator, partial [Litorivicinaceae bacterium]
VKLALLCLAGAASPGLSWLLILSMSASKGTRVGISGALGHGLGITAFALITVFGLSALLIAMPKLTSALTLLGIGLLVFFGYQLVTAGKSPLPEGLSTRGGFIAGFSIAIVNPKVLVFFLAVFGPFVDPNHPASTQMLMGLLAGGIDAGVYLGVAVAGSTLRTLLNEARIQRMNQLIGGLLFMSGLWILGKEISSFV